MCTKLHLLANNDISSFDISTCKLWYAIVLLMKADYTACLRTVNGVLSRIPPFALLVSCGIIKSSNESKSLYEQVYQESGIDIMDRARNSWLIDLFFKLDMLDNVPLAISCRIIFL